MLKMPIARRTAGRAGGNCAVDLRVVLGTIGEWPAMPSQLSERSWRTDRVEETVDLIRVDPWRRCKNLKFENALVFKISKNEACQHWPSWVNICVGGVHAGEFGGNSDVQSLLRRAAAMGGAGADLPASRWRVAARTGAG
jgi:hypothetical protein